MTEFPIMILIGLYLRAKNSKPQVYVNSMVFFGPSLRRVSRTLCVRKKTVHLSDANFSRRKLGGIEPHVGSHAHGIQNRKQLKRPQKTNFLDKNNQLFYHISVAPWAVWSSFYSLSKSKLQAHKTRARVRNNSNYVITKSNVEKTLTFKSAYYKIYMRISLYVFPNCDRVHFSTFYFFFKNNTYR